MLASAVISLYNKEKYIERAVRSLLTQTIQDIEVIVVNDGSTDASVEVVESIHDPRVILLHQENAGPGAACNTGLARAQGKYIACLGADDEWCPEFFEQSIQSLEQATPDVAFVHTGAKVAFSNGGELVYPLPAFLHYGLNRLDDSFSHDMLLDLMGKLTFCAMVVRREVFSECGMFFAKDGCRFQEDQYLLINILMKYSFIRTEDVLAIVHATPDSLTHSITGMTPLEPWLAYGDDIVSACPTAKHASLKAFLKECAIEKAAYFSSLKNWKLAIELLQHYAPEKL